MLCMNPQFLLCENDNIRFLKRETGIQVQWISKYIKKSISHLVLLRAQQWTLTDLKLCPFSIIKKVKKAINARCSQYLLKEMNVHTEWVEELIRETKPDTFVFDWVSPSAFTVAPLVKKAHESNIPTFALPHGINMYSNLNVNNIPKKPSESMTFDHYVSQGLLCRKHLENGGIPAEKIIDIGSLRFCRQWMDFYSRNVVSSTFESPCDDSMLKIVFFLTKLTYNVDRELLLETIREIAIDTNSYLIIKPHTRGMDTRFLQDLKEELNLDIQCATSSVRLSEWCDVGIVIGSSIGLQILHDNKLLLYLDYLDTNRSYYDDTGACWRMDSISDLQKALQTIKSDRMFRPYESDAVQQLFINCVYAGDVNRDVLEDYFDLITSESHSD